MTHSEFFLKANYALFDEMVIYDYFIKKGLAGTLHSFGEWHKYAERALAIF